MSILIYFPLLTLLLSLKCTAQNHHQLCLDRSSSITCRCTSNIRKLDLEDDHDGFFQDAYNITIINCGMVHLTPPSLINAEHLQSLYLINNEEVILDTEFPRSFSTLVIVNVTKLAKLHKPLFNRRQHMRLLKIQNTNVKIISAHTFSELRVEHIEFLNSRFQYLSKYSIFISDKQIQSDVRMPFHVIIKDCEFNDIPSNAITFIGAEEVKIENVKFTGALNKTAVIINATHIYFIKNDIAKMQSNALYFNLSYAKSFMFKENILPCHCKSECKAETTAVLQNIEFFEKTYRRQDFNLCSKLQNNFCLNDNSLSHVIYLQQQCGNNYLYNKLKQLNCTHSENAKKKCRNKGYIKSASLIFSSLAVAFSTFALKRLLL